jgi:hypothetical protein
MNILHRIVYRLFQKQCLAAMQSLTTERIVKLETELHRLQIIEAQRGAGWDQLTKQQDELNELALFVRENYAREIAAGEHRNMPRMVDLVRHYLAKERRHTIAVRAMMHHENEEGAGHE